MTQPTNRRLATEAFTIDGDAATAAIAASDATTKATAAQSAAVATASTDATNKANAAQSAAVQRVNHTGTQSADTLTDGATNKAFLATERTKLTGVATGATANDTDANLKARANHTGTQTLATISDAGTAAAVNTGTTSGTVPVLGAGGVLAIGRLATGTPTGAKFVRDDGTLATPAGGGSAVPLAVISYGPATAATVSTTSATLVDIDATNLAVTFTVPTSGKVLVTLNAWSTGGNTSTYQWGLRNGTTPVVGADHGINYNTPNTPIRQTALMYITGLTPGASLTWKWAHRLSFGSTAAGVSVSSNNPALMIVTEA